MIRIKHSSIKHDRIKPCPGLKTYGEFGQVYKKKPKRKKPSYLRSIDPETLKRQLLGLG